MYFALSAANNICMEKEITKTELVIIGAGPAGMTAAIYAARAGLSPVILESGIVGGQVSQSSIIENYPGFPEITGAELSEKFRGHLRSLSVEIDEFDLIERAELSDGRKRIVTESRIYEPKAVIIAAGTSPKKLPIESGDRFDGKGVHYCALCDGYAYKGKTVGVVGGGSAAVEEALYLSGIAEKVIIIRRKDSFHAEKADIAKMENAPNIDILYNTDILDVGGESSAEYAVVKDGSGNVRRLPLSAVFVYIGSEPRTELFRDSVNLDGHGYVIAGEDTKTNINGVFAAGDVRTKRYRQIVTAVSDGAAAALAAAEYISVH